MAFTFGAPSPAGGGGGFSFGAPSPAPTSAAAPTAPAGGFSFGAAPSPAAPAPPGGGLFGGGGGGFASAFGAPAPAPASGGFGGFGASQAPVAPSPGGFSFGSSAPAPGGFAFGGQQQPSQQQQQPSLFGGTSLFGTPAPAQAPAQSPFGFQQQQPQQQQPQALASPPPPVISGNMPYSNLSPQHRAAIDGIFQMIRDHQRTMQHVKGMAPQPLISPTTGRTGSGRGTGGSVVGRSPGRHGSHDETPPPLSRTAMELRLLCDETSQQISKDARALQALASKVSDLHQQALVHVKWPLEAVAIRRGVRFPSADRRSRYGPGGEEKKQDGDHGTGGPGTGAVDTLLDSQLQYVDRLDKLPSSFLWLCLQEWEERAEMLLHRANQQLELLSQMTPSATAGSRHAAAPVGPVPIESVVQLQRTNVARMALRVSQIRQEMIDLRHQYAIWERERGGENVLDKAEWEDRVREQRYKDEALLKYVEANSATAETVAPGAAPVATFGAATPGTGAAPATPAPAGGFSFGLSPSTPAAPATQPPPPAFGGFGGTPNAPLAFGATTTTPAVRKKSSSRSSSRLRS